MLPFFECNTSMNVTPLIDSTQSWRLGTSSHRSLCHFLSSLFQMHLRDAHSFPQKVNHRLEPGSDRRKSYKNWWLWKLWPKLLITVCFWRSRDLSRPDLSRDSFSASKLRKNWAPITIARLRELCMYWVSLSFGHHESIIEIGWVFRGIYVFLQPAAPLLWWWECCPDDHWILAFICYYWNSLRSELQCV